MEHTFNQPHIIIAINLIWVPKRFIKIFGKTIWFYGTESHRIN
jgi:hypothetical protein